MRPNWKRDDAFALFGGEAHEILLGGDELRLVIGRKRMQVAYIAGAISMVIGKWHSVHRRCSAGVQRIEEFFRSADTGKGKICLRRRRRERLDGRAKNRPAKISQRKRRLPVSHQNNRIGAREPSLDRFSQGTFRDHISIAETSLGIDDQD